MRQIKMKRSWIYLLVVLIITASICQGFTVERSSLGRHGTFSHRNWSSPIFQNDRRMSIEKIFNGQIHTADIENILHDSGLRQSVKLPDEKCSSSSEDPQRAKRSGDIFDKGNRSTIVENIVTEPKKSIIVASSTEMKNSGSTIVSSVREIKNFESTIVSSSKVTKRSEPTVLSSLKDAKTLEPTIVSSSKVTKTSEPPIVSSSKGMKSSESTIISAANRAKTLTSTIVSTDNEIKNLQLASEKMADSRNLKNVVLLLIDDAGTGRENLMKLFQQEFPVRGVLQSCRESELSRSNKIFLGDSLVSRKINEECDCDNLLRLNIGSLLSWARHKKEMSTGAISATNFSIPPPIESPKSQFSKEFEGNDEITGLRQEMPRLKSEPRDIWHLIDMEKQTVGEKQSTPSVSVIPTIKLRPKQERTDGYDGIWDIFEMFSRIRIAFFRIFLESLGNLVGTEDDFNGKKMFAVQPSLVELMTDTMRQLTSVSSDKGFVFIVAAPGNELFAVLDVLQREISTKETLLVISGMCSSTNVPVPFFVHGPGEKSLNGARTISDLPVLIRGVMTEGCVDKSCKNQRPEKPVALTMVQMSSIPQKLPLKRVGRADNRVDAKNDGETSELTTNEKSTKQADDEFDDDRMLVRHKKESGAPHVRVDNVAKILGIVTSIAAMLALNSS